MTVFMINACTLTLLRCLQFPLSLGHRAAVRENWAPKNVIPTMVSITRVVVWIIRYEQDPT
jgi:hypothetical protein